MSRPAVHILHKAQLTIAVGLLLCQWRTWCIRRRVLACRVSTKMMPMSIHIASLRRSIYRPDIPALVAKWLVNQAFSNLYPPIVKGGRLENGVELQEHGKISRCLEL
ncbi:hypothetical protein GGR53DRAFT_282101 [Hypoxylon sp. FL1150]|nr:hypothetical protein GGR53DRAFT_282101 [Hypoxylon sp. FL1150]